MKVAVVGAGIIGLTTAFRLKERHPGVDVVVISKDFTPNVTSDVAAGFWEPIAFGQTPLDLMRRWSKETYDYAVEKLKTDEDAAKYGVSEVDGYNISDQEQIEIPFWYDVIHGFRVLPKEEISKHFPANIKSCFAFTTIFIEPSKYIPWLSERFIKLGGKFIQKEVKALDDIANCFDVIVNCTGLGSRTLLNDMNVYPVRGQVLRVKAPWIKKFLILDTEEQISYILPNQDLCIVGGTAYENDFRTEEDPADTKKIWDNAKKLMPSLQHAEILKVCVGLRPVRRNGIRVEKVDLEVQSSRTDERKIVKVVHNYGHGGSGVTVCWGCAGEAVTLIEQCMNELRVKKSKL